MIVGTRGSRLALIQTEAARQALGIEGDIQVIKTHGDKSKRQIKSLEGRAFTRELDLALIEGEIDLAVHSLKDIPVEDFPKELEIACIVQRGDPRDCILSNHRQLPKGAVVGASSERRKAELLNMRGDLKVKPLRGNVPTRIGKLDSGEYDAIVTAKCALDRLGISGRATQVFEVNEMVPAAGQGAIAVVKRKDFAFDPPSDTNLISSTLERLFIRGLGACRNPVGAYCEEKANVFRLRCLLYYSGERLTPTFEGSPEDVGKQVIAWKSGLGCD